MNRILDRKLEPLFQAVVKRNPGEAEFEEAVREVFESLGPVLVKSPEFGSHKIIGPICEPERQIIFRVPWQDDRGQVQIHRGFRVQVNSALGATAVCTSVRPPGNSARRATTSTARTSPASSVSPARWWRSD